MGLATVGFELGTAFYNAILPDLVPQDRVGRVSGWGWGVGYAGGLARPAPRYPLFVSPHPPSASSPPPPPLFGLDPAQAEHVRIVMPLAALWFALFALPLFLWVP